MICLKGCSKEIDMLNELLSAAIQAKSEIIAIKDNRIKELESKLLNFERVTHPLMQKVYCSDTYGCQPISNKLSGTPKPNWELPQKPKDYNAKWVGIVHTSTDLGTCYNEPVTGQPLFSPDFVGEIPLPTSENNLSRYPAKKKK